MKHCSIAQSIYNFFCKKKRSGIFVNTRISEYSIDSIFLKRQSLYAMTGDSLAQKDLMALFEAAKWAPSEYNVQPWRFIYAHRDTPYWQPLFDLLVPFNQEWAQRAAVLVVVISKKIFDNGKSSATHSFVTGAAWMSFVLEATMRGIIAHGIAGFDYDKAYKTLQIPEDFIIEMMCVVGIPGKKELLSQNMAQRENPSARKKLEEIVAEGTFNFMQKNQL